MEGSCTPAAGRPFTEPTDSDVFSKVCYSSHEVPGPACLIRMYECDEVPAERRQTCCGGRAAASSNAAPRASTCRPSGTARSRTTAGRSRR